MAEFNGHLQSLRPSSSEISSDFELIDSNQSAWAALSMNVCGLVAFSNDNFCGYQQPEFSLNFGDNIQNLIHPSLPVAVPVTQSSVRGGDLSHESKPEKDVKPTGLAGNKRKRSNEKGVDKPTEVIHVRARRGQATDSHSLAERVRRQKINERLRCLQDLVPGCYKTMGLAVMLDVIINYVRSLQNQIELLSMKLSAASMFCDFNLPEVDAVETVQWTSAYKAPETETMILRGSQEGLEYYQSV